MCEALEELMKEELDEMRNRGLREGRKEGRDEGRNEERRRINELNQRLALADRVEDIIRASGDKQYQEELLEEFGL